jgi:hypothetical protein
MFWSVYFEHLIYSAALAVIVGMIFSRYTGRDPSWIIMAVAFVPDLDIIFQVIHKFFRRVPTFDIYHGDFHTLMFLVLFSISAAAILSLFHFRFSDMLLCSALGIAAHFFEDAFVYKTSYLFLWPLSSTRFGFGFMTESLKTLDVLRIANSTVLAVGILLMTGAILLRTVLEGSGWWKVFLQGGRKRSPVSCKRSLSGAGDQE